jgi:gamma-glutamylcyclotransferase (GGCT)/AIG2-like uncharacterized protein YtfP
MGRVRLFVYGSLKRGGRHHDELAGAVFLGPATTQAGYRLEPLGEYLALISVLPPPQAKAQAQAQPEPEPEHETGTATTVPGELFELDESKLSALDAFEGDAYERGNVRLEGGSLQKPGFALAYFRKAR